MLTFLTHEVIMHTALMEPTKVEHLFIDRGKVFNIGNVNKWLRLRKVGATEET